jgi:hypothetical protein
VQYFELPLFPPGEIQSTCFFEGELSNVWRYYSLARTGKQASLLMSGHEASLMNPAVALPRHLAGMPTDEKRPVNVPASVFDDLVKRKILAALVAGGTRHGIRVNDQRLPPRPARSEDHQD